MSVNHDIRNVLLGVTGLITVVCILFGVTGYDSHYNYNLDQKTLRKEHVETCMLGTTDPHAFGKCTQEANKLYPLRG